jgi:hypothetical protein
LQTAAETKARAVVLNALTELAATEMEQGSGERALELVLLCRQHSATKRQVGDQAEAEPQLTLGRWGQQRNARLERLWAELNSKLTPRQIASAQTQARSQTLADLVQAILATSE